MRDESVFVDTLRLSEERRAGSDEFTLPLGESGRRPGEGGVGRRIRRVLFVQEDPPRTHSVRPSRSAGGCVRGVVKTIGVMPLGCTRETADQALTEH